ncbi:MAG: YkgJ family cysteine cluster protein [Clostridiales bacterium]|nr:YkgJ family cysteine cluster protein [Clostridiales bacterium]MCF8021885.1 YkgJ family cysteine cluster protein [Clostridiales bacterium]
MKNENIESAVFPRDKKFNFSCHEGLECFNSCCRNINIFLTPYDILRIKNKLNITSTEFLNQYTKQLNKGNITFIILKMDETNEKKCPFVTPEGCSIYSVRPWSCRIAPVDLKEDGYSFIFDNSFCKGLNEDKEWTLDQWMENQGVKIYEEKERLFREIPSKIQFTDLKNIDNHIKEIIFMVSYDIDRLRKFVFESGFLQVFNVKQEEAEKIRYDDEELLQFGFRWLLNDYDLEETMDLWEEVF